MARKVFISSDMSIDEAVSEVAEQDPVSALIWPWVLTCFDDWGRAKASPREIKNSTFPANDLVTTEVIGKAISLYGVRLVHLYEAEGKPYMCINPDKWFKYQTHIRGEKRENDRSKHPAPVDDNSAQVRASARSNAQSADNLTNRIPSPSPSLSPSPSNQSSSVVIGQNAFALYQKHEFGKLDELSSQFIGESIDDHGEDWVKRAMIEAVKSNKKSWSYVQGILKRWKATGHSEPWTLEREEPKPQQQQSFRNYNRPQRPSMPVVKDDGKGDEVSPEQMEQMLELARKLKGESA